MLVDKLSWQTHQVALKSIARWRRSVSQLVLLFNAGSVLKLIFSKYPFGIAHVLYFKRELKRY